MCGVFGYVGHAAPFGSVIRSLAEAAARRGPHAWGAVSDRGAFHRLRRYGSGNGEQAFDDYNQLQKVAMECRALIGHCRLATTPGPLSHMDSQPIHLGEMPDGRYEAAIAHNGTVPNEHVLRGYVESIGLSPRTGNDSELLGLAAIAQPGTIGEQLAAVICRLYDENAVVMMLGAEGLAVYRRGHPLFVCEAWEGLYFSSVVPQGFAGRYGWKPLPENEVREYTIAPDRVRARVIPHALPQVAEVPQSEKQPQGAA